MSDRDLLLDRLKFSTRTPSVVARIRRDLTQEGTRVLSSRSGQVSVSETQNLWSTRRQNMDLTGQELVGIDGLLERLAELTPGQSLEQFAYIASDSVGNLFFDHASHSFVGAVLVDHVASQTAA